MRKLLSANFARLFKSKAFWTLESICLGLGVIFYSLFIINTRNIGENWLLRNANYYFFFFIVYIGVMIAIFSSMFIGTDYSDGTIRNKLCVGHSRRNIYLANLIVIYVVGLLFCISHIASAFVIGIPGVGTGAIMAISSPLWRIGCCIVIVAGYASIFTLLTMLDNNKARTAVVSLVLALILIVGGMYVYGRLQEPEMISQMVMQEDGSFQMQEIPNNNYISGTTRMIYGVIEDLLPSSGAMHIADRDGVFDWKMPCCLMGTSLLLTLGGIIIFEKEDIR